MRALGFLTEMDPIELPDTDDHVERLLDQALEATFPASDPVAVSSAAAAALTQVGRIPSG